MQITDEEKMDYDEHCISIIKSVENQNEEESTINRFFWGTINLDDDAKASDYNFNKLTTKQKKQLIKLLLTQIGGSACCCAHINKKEIYEYLHELCEILHIEL